MSGTALRRQSLEGNIVENLRRALVEKTHTAAPASPREIKAPLQTHLSVVDAALQGGLPRGKLIEIAGGAGKMAFTLLALAAATRRGELCAFVDCEDALDVQSAARVGVVLDRLLWVRTSTDISTGTQASNVKDRASSQSTEAGVDNALKAVDLLLSAGGFGLIVLYAGEKGRSRSWRATSVWPRLVQRCEKARAAVLVASDDVLAGSFAAATLRCAPGEAVWERAPGGRLCLFGHRAVIEVERNRLGAPGDSEPLERVKHLRPR